MSIAVMAKYRIATYDKIFEGEIFSIHIRTHNLAS